MDFITAMCNTEYTQNGALTNKSSLSACVDLFSMGVSSSNKEELILKALKENPLLTFKIVFYLRDCRQGQGNKDILHALFKLAEGSLPQLFPYIPEIGYWKDLVKVYNEYPASHAYLLGLFSKALYKDDNLCAKWLPRQGKLAADLSMHLNLSRKQYRKTLVKLSNTVEQKICARQWSTVEYKSVPSRANKLYSQAFLNHDSSRRNEFLSQVESGEVTMNASQLYPHEIVGMAKTDSTANALWKSLPNYMENAQNVFSVIDTSGSMSWSPTIPGGYCPLDIALGLGLYFAEHNTGPFKNIWCTFSNKPEIRKIQGTTLTEKLHTLNHSGWGGSTNLQAVFDLILAHSTKENVPKIILIVSDMEFNYCTNITNYDLIKAKYVKAGIKMPTLVFWRVDVKVAQQPVTFDEQGTVLINGYSPTIMKELLAGDLSDITPEKMMLKAIGDKYDYLDKLLIKE